MLGFSEDELHRKHCVDFSPSEDAEKDSALFQQLRAGSIDHYQLEKRYFRRDGSLVWGSLSISLLRSRPSSLVLAMVEDITAKKSAEEAIAGIRRKLVAIQEEERTRIARDLHDDINQRLALLTAEMERLIANPPSSSAELSRQLSDFKERIAEISADVQSISHELHSPQLEYLGLVAGMKSFCREFSARQAVEIDLKNDDIPEPVSHEVSLCLFRILQEALHNAAKHSKVRRFEVRLDCSANQLHLTVSDRGTGFDADTAINKGGMGLISMQERVHLLNGSMEIQSKPMGGTTIHVRLPLESKQGAQSAAG
jgi:PAS domain S-box-containing protein